MRFRPSSLAFLALTGAFLPAEEGMWTLDSPPVQAIRSAYGFELTAPWLDHVRRAAVRFPSGSGAFVSQDGLVLTNHHVGRTWIQKASGPGQDFLQDGFVAPDRSREIALPGLKILTLQNTENVTVQVNQAVRPGMDELQASRARREALEALREATQTRTGLSCETVSLYQGSENWIYTYRVHRDVRLVMAPESQIAFFGGDPDNYTFPRFDLDFCLFRVYEEGQPYHPQAFLKPSSKGLASGDLTFVIGHPGRTDRQKTWAQMVYDRDIALPLQIREATLQREVLTAYLHESPKNPSRIRNQIFTAENYLKRWMGYLEGLRDTATLAAIQKAEGELRLKVAESPELQSTTGESWTRIEAALGRLRARAEERRCIAPRHSTLLRQALQLLRLPEELRKPSTLRLPEFQDERLESLKAGLLAQDPIDPELEIRLLAADLEDARRTLGPDHPFLTAMLEGQSPRKAAERAVQGSALGHPSLRKRLLEGGAKALASSRDTMIHLAKQMNPLAQELERTYQEEPLATLEEQGRRIAQARYQIYGSSRYPDATFTLRMSYGPVASFSLAGTPVPPFTTFAGLYDRAWGWGPHAGEGAWALPTRWQERRNHLDLSTPFNFCHAVDIIGGNSGSPVVDRKGELVGLIFDGNLGSLPGNYAYNASSNRGISLDIRAIREALRTIYDAPQLAQELLPTPPSSLPPRISP